MCGCVPWFIVQIHSADPKKAVNGYAGMLREQDEKQT